MFPSGIISLLSDFGTKDPFVGVMRGVILSRFAEAKIVDLAHGVSPQDVVEGAFWLERSARWFPPGTVHVAVVDPGVGSGRGVLAVRADDQLFVAPDNGLLGPVMARAHSVEVRDLDRERLGLVELSRTFHGRDVFAPAGAELASGRVAFEDIGPIKQPAAGLELPRPTRSTAGASGQIVCIDHFGNLISNIDRELIGGLGSVSVELGELSLPLSETYSSVAVGEYVALINAFDTLEVARRDGDAAASLGLSRGAPLAVRAAG